MGDERAPGRRIDGHRTRDPGQPDVGDLEQWRPEAEETYALVEFSIGESGAEAADVFAVVVATPEGLAARRAKNNFVLAQRGTLVVTRFDWSKVRAHLYEVVASCAREDWRQSLIFLLRYFYWEYDNDM